jgi:DHA3 family macrolide efflux protein-like MFS transporter
MFEQVSWRKKINMQNWKSRFFTLWSGQAVSMFGSSLVGFALIWWLTTTTGSATVLATASLAGLLPQALLSPIAGVLVDRNNRRRIMFLSDTTVMLCTLVLTYLFSVGAAEIWHVYLILFIRSAGGAFQFPAMQASTSLMVPQEHLTRVSGLNQMLQGLNQIVAPPIGALLVTAFPIHQVLLIDAFTALFAIVPLLFLNIPQPKPTDRQGQPRNSFFEDLREGVGYVVAWRGLAIILCMSVLLNFLLTPTSALTPILVTKYFGGAAREMGFWDAAWGIGVVAGGLLMSVWGGFKRKIVTSLVGVIGLGVLIVGIGLLPPTMLSVAIALTLFLGAVNPVVNGPIFALLQTVVAPNMQGRVMSLMMSVSIIAAPLSLLVSGPIADRWGVQIWYLAGGVACLIVGVLGFLIRPVMNIEEEARASTEASPILAV